MDQKSVNLDHFYSDPNTKKKFLVQTTQNIELMPKYVRQEHHLPLTESTGIQGLACIIMHTHANLFPPKICICFVNSKNLNSHYQSTRTVGLRLPETSI